jgi:hypothetical protein
MASDAAVSLATATLPLPLVQWSLPPGLHGKELRLAQWDHLPVEAQLAPASCLNIHARCRRCSFRFASPPLSDRFMQASARAARDEALCMPAVSEVFGLPFPEILGVGTREGAREGELNQRWLCNKPLSTSVGTRGITVASPCTFGGRAVFSLDLPDLPTASNISRQVSHWHHKLHDYASTAASLYGYMASISDCSRDFK